MSSTRNAEVPAVLRGILLHAQPHALVRPGRPNAEPVLKMRQVELDQPVSGSVSGAATRTDDARDAVLAEGWEQGWAAGRAAATAAEGKAFQAALAEARSLAVEEGRLEGLARGRDEAHREGLRLEAQAKERADQAALGRIDRLDALLQALLAKTAHRLEEAEDDLVALSHEAVCRILGAEAVQPARLRAMVTHLLGQHGQRAQLAVHVHPDDLAALIHEPAGTRDTPWRWVGDSTVQLGGVVLRSSEGSLDARLETQLNALRDALLGVRRERKDLAQLEAPAGHGIEADK